MAKKKDKKDKDAKKARMAEKQAKNASKSEKKQKKSAKKAGEDDDDVAIEDILANYAKEQEQFEAITIEACDRPSKRSNATMVASPLHGKRELLLFGGETTNGPLAVFYNDLYSYSIDTDQWRHISSPNSPLPRSGHAMCVHPSGIILMFGGEFSSPKQNTFYHYGDTWILDPAKKEWQKVEQKKGPSARSGHRMTFWKNYVLLHGGFRDLATSTTYLNDLWAFDVSTYKWHQIEVPTTHIVPDARSGHSFMPHSDGAVVWGGYSKVKAAKGQQKGKVFQDTWQLKMKADLKGCRWERRKKSGFAPSPRVGCSMVFHKGRGLLFGGVYDTDETEESLESDFYNNLFAYQIEMSRWFTLQLRSPKKKKVETVVKVDRDEDLEANLSAILRSSGIEDDDEEDNTPKTPEIEEEPVDAVEIKEYPSVGQLPHPRFNATTAVVDDTFFIYGGVFERGDQEFNLDSMYAIDLNRLDGMKVFWEDLRELEQAEEVSDDEDDEDDEDEDDEDEDEEAEKDDDDDDSLEEEEEEEEEEPEPEGIPDPRPWLPHPKAFENLRSFYSRTGPQFLEWALSNSKNARGKDLKRIAFELSEERWWERREEVRAQEDQLEEMGGVGEIIEREAPRAKSRR